MVKKINELTQAQKDALPGWVDKWIKIALSTEPANSEKCEAAYRACYRFAELDDGVPILWVLSPKLGAIAASLADEYCGAAKKGTNMTALVGKAIDDAHKHMVKPRRKKLTWHHWFGRGYWAEWPAFESFFREVCDLELPGDLTERAIAYADTVIHGSYWWPNRHFILACDRPKQILFDDAEQPRLHSTIGQAVSWRDGWGLYFWHGIEVPKAWIEDKASITPTMALTWENIEQRRAACEIVGWDRILNELKAKVIDCDEDPTIGELIEVNLPQIGKERFLRVLCGTGRTFAMPVPAEMKTALEAQAWGDGFDLKDWIKPEVRT